jgi:hypothetical protein
MAWNEEVKGTQSPGWRQQHRPLVTELQHAPTHSLQAPSCSPITQCPMHCLKSVFGDYPKELCPQELCLEDWEAHDEFGTSSSQRVKPLPPECGGLAFIDNAEQGDFFAEMSPSQATLCPSPLVKNSPQSVFSAAWPLHLVMSAPFTC